MCIRCRNESYCNPRPEMFRLKRTTRHWYNIIELNQAGPPYITRNPASQSAASKRPMSASSTYITDLASQPLKTKNPYRTSSFPSSPNPKTLAPSTQTFRSHPCLASFHTKIQYKPAMWPAWLASRPFYVLVYCCRYPCLFTSQPSRASPGAI
jgi:hypothetical protein